MVEGTRLESVRCGNVSGGSNPPLSATKFKGSEMALFFTFHIFDVGQGTYRHPNFLIKFHCYFTQYILYWKQVYVL